MIENLFIRQIVIAKHKEAPLLSEREDYLRHLVRDEKPRRSVQNAATLMLDVIRVMKMTILRQVNMNEIALAAERWAGEELVHRKRPNCKTSVRRFILLARGWFRFHGVLTPARPACCFDRVLESFVHEMRCNMGLSPVSIRNSAQRIRDFLVWTSRRHDSLYSVALQDIEDFLDAKRQSGCRPVTLAGHGHTLRPFLRYAESCGWCKAGLWRQIPRQPIRRRDFVTMSPSWKEVRRLIDETDDVTSGDCRAKAILLLCAVYGLRASEIIRLALDDFDWYNETLTVRRSKRGRIQQFPIQFEVGEAIIRYLQTARPRCSCRNLFVTHFTPYRPLKDLWAIVATRIRKSRIRSQKVGPHTLRHACATELLRKGTSLRDIADFLGHRSMGAVSIYAKYDSRTLHDVAAFSLRGIR